MFAQKLADACLDFRPRPAETHAARIDQTMGIWSPRPRRIIEVNADRGCRHAAPQQARPSVKLGRSRRASGPPNPICLESTPASSAPARQEMIDPALPNTAERSWSGSWSRYWWPIVRVSAYLRASERMSAKLSVAND